MDYTKENIIEIVKQILGDLELSYYEEKDFIVNLGEPDEFEKLNGFSTSWHCSVYTSDWQFNTEEGIYSFTIDNEDSNRILFFDCSGGQIPHSFIKKDENSKYYREYIN